MIEFKNFSLAYGDKDRVLEEISFRIGPGQCVLFTGKSGSGKSSLINSINGLASRYDGAQVQGQARLGGRDLASLELYQIAEVVSSVFQNPKTHFFNVNTTMELVFFLENIGLAREEMEKRLKESLEVFPISHLLDRDIFKLSGGEKQILSLACAYIAGTDIIVLDEPSSNLDDRHIGIIRNMLKILKDRGKTLVLAEHRIYYLMDLVDRVLVLSEGKIRKDYSREDFLALKSEDLRGLGIRDKDETPLLVKELGGKGDLEVTSLDYDFKGLGKSLHLQDLHFKRGKVYGILGANGLGKSSLVRSLIGLEKKSREEVYLDGKRLGKKDRLKMSSLVMQDVNHQLFSDSVEGEVCLGDKDPDPFRVQEILKRLGLDDFKDRHPMSLSGGQKQRLAIASVLYKDSPLIFFDEPTSGMDYSNMVRVSRLIKDKIGQDRIIFIVSHDKEFLNITADYVLSL